MANLKEQLKYATNVAEETGAQSRADNPNGDFAVEYDAFLDACWEHDENIDNGKWDSILPRLAKGFRRGWDRNDLPMSNAELQVAMAEVYS